MFSKTSLGCGEASSSTSPLLAGGTAMTGTSHPASLRSANKRPRPRLAQQRGGQAEGQQRGRLRRLPLHLKGALPSACPVEPRHLLPDVCTPNPLPPLVMSDVIILVPSCLYSGLMRALLHVALLHVRLLQVAHVAHVAHVARAHAPSRLIGNP